MNLDFATALNDDDPHVKVYDAASGASVALVPIRDGNVDQAEQFACAIRDCLSRLMGGTATVENYQGLLIIKKEEDCKFLTDRFGYVIDDDAMTGTDRNIIDLLLARMWGEISFIVRRHIPDEQMNDDDIHGMLLEVEYADGFVPPNTDAEAALAIMGDVPGVVVYFTHGGHVVMERWAIRAFIPAELASAEAVATVGKRLIALFC